MLGPSRDNPYPPGGPAGPARPPYPPAGRAQGPGFPGGPPPGGPAGRPHRSWPQRIVLLVGTVGSVFCLAASAFTGYQYARVAGIDRVAGTGTLVKVQAGEPTNWLLVGSDNRDGIDGTRTDTIMVVRIDPATTRVNVLSLQRDLWVPIAGTGQTDRINTAYGERDTPERLIETIKLNFGLDIHHYVEVGFESFKGIVDAVGGVPMYFDQPLKDRKAGLAVLDRGCVSLDGDQALAFARSRSLEYQDERGRWHEDPSVDYGRISRQQYFIRRMFERAASQAKNPKTFNDLVGVATANVRLDEQVDLNATLDMVRRFGDVSSDAIKSWTLPTEEHTTAGGALVLRPVHDDDSATVLNIFKGFDPEDADPPTVKVVIENGTGAEGQAAQVADAFRAIGYQIEVRPGAAPPAERTTIRHGYGGQVHAGQIERHLTAGATVVPDAALDPGAVVLTTGADLTTVLRRPKPYVPPPLPPAPVEPETTTAPAGKGGNTTRPSTTTTALTHNSGDDLIGVVPGQPPAGVTCN